MSILTLVQDAARTLKQNAPTVVTSSSDELVKQMRELADQTGYELMKRAEWQELVREVVFYARATTDQGYLVSIATDFDRFIDDTLWNRTDNRKVAGPVTPAEWQQDQSNTSTSPPQKYRLREKKLLLGPDAPSSGDRMAAEYISRHWVESTAGTGLASINDDSDILRVPEEIFKLGLIFRFLKTNGFEYAEQLEDYENAIEIHTSGIGGNRVLFLGGTPQISVVNVQDNNFPSS